MLVLEKESFLLCLSLDLFISRLHGALNLLFNLLRFFVHALNAVLKETAFLLLLTLELGLQGPVFFLKVLNRIV